MKLGLTQLLPTPKPSKKLPTRQAHFAMLVHEQTIYLERQVSPGIWGGLLSLPRDEDIEVKAAALGLLLASPVRLTGFKHAFTHFKLEANVSLYRAIQPPKGKLLAHDAGSAYAQESRWIKAPEFQGAALPRPIKTYLLEHALLL